MLKSVFGVTKSRPHFPWRILSVLVLGLAFHVQSQETYRVGVEDYSYYPLYDFTQDRPNLLKDVLTANKECESATLEISSKGLARIQFKVDDYDALYYLVAETND